MHSHEKTEGRDCSILISNHILHKALCVTQDIYWGYNDEEFLTNVLYLSVFLEKFVINDGLVVREQLNIDSPELDFFKSHGDDNEAISKIRLEYEKLRVKEGADDSFESLDQPPDDDYYEDYYLPDDPFEEDESDIFEDIEEEVEYNDEVDIDEASTFGRRLDNNLIFHRLDRGLLRFEQMKVGSYFTELIEQQFEDGHLDVGNAYLELAKEQIKYAITRRYSFIPDYTTYMSRAIAHVDSVNFVHSLRLAEEYDNLSKHYRGEIEKLVRNGRDISIYLPPITAFIFERCEKPEAIFDVALEMRFEFEKVRNAFAIFEHSIINDELPLRESLNAFYELEEIIKSFGPPTDNSIVTSIGEWRDLSNLVKLIDGINPADMSSLIQLGVGKPLSMLVEGIKHRKVRYLTKFNRDFLNIRNYGRLVERLFKKEISNKHIEHARRHGFANLFIK